MSSQRSGIYRIDGPGRFYIGSAKTIGRRWIEHRRDLRRGDHANPHLQAAWIKYGESAFTLTVVEWVDDPALLLEREQYWLDALDAARGGYNILPTAGSRLGTTHTEETKRRMSRAHSGRKHGPMEQWQKDYYRNLYAGKVLSEETRRKMSESRKGRQFSPETRAKIAAAHRGKTVSAETRAKLAAINTGKKVSEETRRKMSEAHRARFERQQQVLREA